MTRPDVTRSVVRAVAFGASGALLGAAACAAVVVGTGEYETAVTYALLGFIVAVAVAVARPAIPPVWMRALSMVLALLGVLVSEYVIARHVNGLTGAPLLLPLHDTVTLLHDQFAANLIVLLCAGFALLTAASAPTYVESAMSRSPASADDSRASQRLWQWINGQGGWLTATAAAVTGLVTLALLTGSRPGSITHVAFEQVKAGDCYNDPPDDSSETLPEVPCQQPHDAQVFFVFAMPAGGYPGDDAVDASADRTCGDRFTRLGYTPSGPFDYDYFTPERDAWEAGDRSTQCALVRADGHKLHQRLRIR
ncbi:MAG TPA: hypothetical protein VH395_04390 [Jatrophihabitantaceae bacterium]|jgi:hypothetical protein